MLLNDLYKKNLISPPKFVLDNTMYLTRMGSVAYGVSNNMSDEDLYGWCIPPKAMIFPHLEGHIEGFGTQPEKFEQYQKHHIMDGEKEYDVTIYNIVKYFQLVMENNPNMIDSLFTDRTQVIHSTNVSEMLRENRKIFLHKGCFKKFKGYAYAQMNKMKRSPIGGRKEGVEKYGYDLKFAYHVVRLLNEVEQILVKHDLDLMENREQLKSIRRGEWSYEQIVEYFNSKEKTLEEAYVNSTLPIEPNEIVIKKLLLNCLEAHYGSMKECIVNTNVSEMYWNKVIELVNKYRGEN
jgi:predicted nucleotidyltransferase